MILFVLPLLLAANAGDHCFSLYFSRNLAAARTCFEQAQTPCNGSSPDLSRLYLATMYMDGQGGKVNRAAAKALFNGCFRDIGVDSLHNRTQRPTGQLDFCRDIGGSTLTSKECNALKGGIGDDEMSAVVKQIRSALKPTEASLLDTATASFNAFVKTDGARTADNYRGGTLAGVAEGQSRNDQISARTRRLQGFAGYKPGTAHDADTALNAAYRKALNAADDQHRKLLIDAERAWIAYRDAEAAFYEQHFGSRYGGAIVRADVNASLARERTAELSANDGR